MQLTVDDADLTTLRTILLRSVAADRDEVRRLNMLSTAYADHARGDAASRELDGVRRRIEVARALLDGLGPDQAG